MSSDNLILEKWFTRNGLAEGTCKMYRASISEFKEFVDKSLSELIDEGMKQQMESIMPMNRSVNEYIFSFKNYLDKKGNAPGTVNHKIAAIKSFYKAYDIQFIDIKTHKGDTVLDKNRGRFIAKEDIRKMLDVCNARNKAIIYTMALTGLAQNEVRNLTIRQFIKYAGLSIGKELETIEDLFAYEDEILEDTIIFEIVRQKVNYRHHFLLPPEATKRIITYLKERYHHRNKNRHIRSLNGPIFITNKGTKMTRTGIGNEIKRIGKLVGFKSDEEGAYSYWRPHSFRKYFI
ncbi:MAG TPA: tyrosine-type recombinase/integrase, partial [Methanobacteriaceae archaeon]|nr:tyrosine-type recombinase/integrase [Methanobacteriaceae archaeon]